jgi:hypothetical protein
MQIWPLQKRIDSLSARISAIEDMIKVKVAHDKSIKEMESFLSDANDNKSIGVDMSKYADKGIQNAMWFLPLDQICATMDKLTLKRQQIIDSAKNQLSVNPILEGITNSSEAYGTNRIKGSFGTMPVQEYQSVIVDFIKNSMIKICDVAAQEFEPESLARLSGLQFIESAPELKSAAIELVKDERMRKMQLSVDVESTKAYYDEAYKSEIDEFYTSLLADIKTAADIASGAPELLPVLKEIIMAKVRARRVGRTFEQNIEKAIDAQIQKLEQQSQNPPPPPQPSPDAQVRANAQIEVEKLRQQAETDRKRMTEQREAAKDAMADRNNQAKIAIENAKNALKNKELDAEIIANQERLRLGLVPDPNIG